MIDKRKIIDAINNAYEQGYQDRDKEIVRCKDCIHNSICSKSVQTTVNDKFTTTIGYKKIDFCSWAK